LKVVSILRLIQAGVIAACMQCITILLLTPIIIFYAHPKAEDPQLPVDDPTVMSLISFMQLVYLFTAVGVALTKHGFIASTGERVHRASRLMEPSDPDRAANTLTISLWFTAMGFAILTLRLPPSFLAEFGWHFGSFEAAPIIWSGMMSIGVACFGANAQAANRRQ
jgi:hypothetical protein